METQIFKVLKGEHIEIIACNDLCKVACITRLVNDVRVYIIIKMVSFTHPALNQDGVKVPDKKWKSFMPIVLKASDNQEFIFDCYRYLSTIGDSYEP